MKTAVATKCSISAFGAVMRKVSQPLFLGIDKCIILCHIRGRTTEDLFQIPVYDRGHIFCQRIGRRSV